MPTKSAGRIDAAIQLHEATFEARESKLGNDHPKTLISCINLAEAYRSGGRTADAIKLYEATLRKARFETRARPSHRARSAVASLTPTCPPGAARGHQVVRGDVQGPGEELGPDDANTLANRGSSAAAYLAAGRTEGLSRLYEATIKAQDSTLGPDHPITLACRSNFAAAVSVRRSTATTPSSCTRRRSKTMNRSSGPTTPARSAARTALPSPTSPPGDRRSHHAVRGDAHRTRVEARAWPSRHGHYGQQPRRHI